VGAYQQRKPSVMITSVQALNPIKTWWSIPHATQVQTKCNQNKMDTERNCQNNRTSLF